MPTTELTSHGRLLEHARTKVLGLSGREAARRAGISESRWRQIVTGWQPAGAGNRIPANPSPRTIVAMALAVQLDPGQVIKAAQMVVEPVVLERLIREITAGSTDQELSAEPVGSPAYGQPDEVESIVLNDPQLSDEMKVRIIKMHRERRERDRLAAIEDTKRLYEMMRDGGGA